MAEEEEGSNAMKCAEKISRLTHTVTLDESAKPHTSRDTQRKQRTHDTAHTRTYDAPIGRVRFAPCIALQQHSGGGTQWDLLNRVLSTSLCEGERTTV